MAVSAENGLHLAAMRSLVRLGQVSEEEGGD